MGLLEYVCRKQDVQGEFCFGFVSIASVLQICMMYICSFLRSVKDNRIYLYLGMH